MPVEPDECPKCGGDSFDLVCGVVEIAGQRYQHPPFWSCNDCLWCSASMEEIKEYPVE